VLELVVGHASHIAARRRVGLQIGEPSTGHGWGLLSSEAQYPINRDKLNSFL
jgi:hypothetical protein